MNPSEKYVVQLQKVLLECDNSGIWDTPTTGSSSILISHTSWLLSYRSFLVKLKIKTVKQLIHACNQKFHLEAQNKDLYG